MPGIRTIAVVAAGLAVTVSAQAGELKPQRGSIDAYIEKVARLRTEVAALAFDPKKLFGPKAGVTDIVTIAYAGDDFGWPVFSMAIRRGCFDAEMPGRHCGSRRVARMVRSPAPQSLRRPRERGSNLMKHMLASKEPLPAALDRAGLEWLEADLNGCPGAARRFEAGRAAVWVPGETFDSGPLPMRAPVLHADHVEVVFADHARRSTYSGYVAEGSPAQWAVELAESLERCWRPSSAVPPWRR